MTALDAGAALCAPFLRDLPADGLSIVVVSRSGVQSTVATSDAIAARLDELQFELGEGPVPDVLLLGRAVLAPDLRQAHIRHGWPLFGVEAIDAGAAGLMTVPMLAGVLTVGAVCMYSGTVRPMWSGAVQRTAAELAAEAVGPAMALATRAAASHEHDRARSAPELRREVHQASGMLMVRLDCTIDEALARLRAYAYAHDRPVDEIAREIVTGALDLGADHD